MTWTGGCLCGAVRFSTDTEPSRLVHCHCGMCRKHGGGAMATFMTFPTEAVTWLGEARTRYPSSEGVHRAFCPNCGSSLTYEREGRLAIMVGVMDHPERINPGDDSRGGRDCHVYVHSQLPWLRIDDELPRLE